MSTNLTQEEIAQLLAFQRGESPVLAEEPEGLSGVQPCSLIAGGERIYRGRMPGLEMVFERFCRSARPSLSKYLNRSVSLTQGKTETVKFGLFQKKLPLPASMHIFRMPPLNGHALLYLSSPLAFSLIEALLGGSGKASSKLAGREFSPIETRLLTKFAALVLEELQPAWSALDSLQCVYVRSEINPLALTLVPSTDNVIVVEIEMGIEAQSAPFSFCLPAALLQPMKEKLASGMQSVRTELDSGAQAKMSGQLKETHCDVRVRLASGTIKVRDLMSLKSGDILPLSTRADEPAKVLVEGKEKFRGKVGTFRGNRAVTITSS